MRDGRELRANLVINNLLNDRGADLRTLDRAAVGGAEVTRRPRANPLADGYGFKQPISYNPTLAMKL